MTRMSLPVVYATRAIAPGGPRAVGDSSPSAQASAVKREPAVLSARSLRAGLSYCVPGLARESRPLRASIPIACAGSTTSATESPRHAPSGRSPLGRARAGADRGGTGPRQHDIAIRIRARPGPCPAPQRIRRPHRVKDGATSGGTTSLTRRVRRRDARFEQFRSRSAGRTPGASPAGCTETPGFARFRSASGSDPGL